MTATGWQSRKVEFAFGIDPLTTGAVTWTDVSADLISVNTTRGRSLQLEQFQAGTATIVLKNDQGKYDNANTSSPYFPNLLPWCMVRISAVTSSGLRLYLFTGYVQPQDGFTQNFISAVHCETTVSCIDAFGLMAVLNLATSVDSLLEWTAGNLDLYNRLTNLGFDTGMTAPIPLDDGATTGTLLFNRAADETLPQLAGVSYNVIGNSMTVTSGFRAAGQPALQWLQELSLTEGAPIFVTQSGDIALCGRYYQASNAAEAIVTPSLYFTFNDQGTGDVPFSIDGFARNFASPVYNKATISPDYADFPAQSYTDTSGNVTIINEYTATGMFNSSADAMQRAQTIVLSYRNAISSVSTLSIDVQSGNNALDAALILELTDVVFVKHKPPGWSAQQRDQVYVEHIAHSLDAHGNWKCDFGFSSTKHTDEYLYSNIVTYDDGTVYDTFYSWGP